MLNVKELDSSLQVLSERYTKSRVDFGTTFINKTNFKPINDFKLPELDTIQEVLLENYNLTDKVAILQAVKSTINNSITSIERRKKIQKEEKREKGEGDSFSRVCEIVSVYLCVQIE